MLFPFLLGLVPGAGGWMLPWPPELVTADGAQPWGTGSGCAAGRGVTASQSVSAPGFFSLCTSVPPLTSMNNSGGKMEEGG